MKMLNWAIQFCGTGNGINMTANKHQGISAWDTSGTVGCIVYNTSKLLGCILVLSM